MRRVFVVLTILSLVCFLSIGIYLTYQGDPTIRLSGLMTIVIAQAIIIIILLFENHVLGRALALTRAVFMQEAQAMAEQWASLQAEIKKKIELECNILRNDMLEIDTKLKFIDTKLNPDEIKIRTTINGSSSPRLSAINPTTEAPSTGTTTKGTRGRRRNTVTPGSSSDTAGTGTILAANEQPAAE